MERIRNSPPPPPPPPIPQPIPQPSNTNDNNNENNPPPTLVQTENVLIASTLTIRSVDGSTIRIKTTSSMTQSDLAHCIMHAALAPSRERDLIHSWGIDSTSDSTWLHIAGLFRERDGLFIPLTMILQDVEGYQMDTFRISRAAEIDSSINEKEQNHHFEAPRLEILVFFVSVILIVYYRPSFELENILEYAVSFVEYAYSTLVRLPSIIVENYITYPLNELYRYGPAIIGIGWEGASLPRICNQITHMGDESFWGRNIEECEQIYRSKELAALHLRRPFIYIFFLYLIFSAVRSLFQSWRARDPSDEHVEMMEVYRAFHILLRQMRKGVGPPARFQPIGRQ